MTTASIAATLVTLIALLTTLVILSIRRYFPQSQNLTVSVPRHLATTQAGLVRGTLNSDLFFV